jgi:hypothetical protein
MARTGNNDFAYDNTGDALVEFFSKAGSLFKNKGTYYGNETTAIELFKSAWIDDNYKSMQLSMWLRDVRGGAGNRSGFREIINWLAKEQTAWMEANLHFIPEVGRWDDLESLVNTPCEEEALKFWVRAIQDGHQLAAKWAPRADRNKIVFNKMRKIAELDPKSWRKLIVKNTNVVETAMCSGNWQNIDYNKVPSVAAARYNNAFNKHDSVRYGKWREALEEGKDENGNEVKVNAAALFPHDVLRALYSNQSQDNKLADAQFAALPDYMDNKSMRIMTICDFSGSMCTPVSGAIEAIDVSLGLGLYCSDRLGKDNPFYRMFIPFSDDSKLISWKDEKFSKAVYSVNDGYCGGTNIQSALKRILDSAKMFKATNDQVPNCLLILSDCQWNCSDDPNASSVDVGLREWEKAGYTKPRIIYWNLSGDRNAPATVESKNVALVSGFSPSLLKAILSGEDFSPRAIMERAIEKYQIVIPSDVKIEKKEVIKDTVKPSTAKKIRQKVELKRPF